MGDETTTFTIKEIPKDDWDNFVRNIDRKHFNERTNKLEDFSIEKYFRILIKRLSKLSREEVSKLIKNNKIKFE